MLTFPKSSAFLAASLFNRNSSQREFEWLQNPERLPSLCLPKDYQVSFMEGSPGPSSRKHPLTQLWDKYLPPALATMTFGSFTNIAPLTFM